MIKLSDLEILDLKRIILEVLTSERNLIINNDNYDSRMIKLCIKSIKEKDKDNSHSLLISLIERLSKENNDKLYKEVIGMLSSSIKNESLLVNTYLWTLG